MKKILIRICKGCVTNINYKHPNDKSCSQKCKDRYWNIKNPRGYYKHLNYGTDPDDDPSWDAHKNY